MMDAMFADVSNAGYRSVMLWVFTKNERARKFYETKGFVATDKVKSSFGTTEICYVNEIGCHK